LHQVGDLQVLELNVKLWCQKVNQSVQYGICKVTGANCHIPINSLYFTSAKFLKNTIQTEYNTPVGSTENL
jgi:hypothetical protein